MIVSASGRLPPFRSIFCIRFASAFDKFPVFLELRNLLRGKFTLLLQIQLLALHADFRRVQVFTQLVLGLLRQLEAILQLKIGVVVLP